MIRTLATVASVATLLLASACSSSALRPAAPSAPGGHVVVVVMENHSYSDIIGNDQAPYLNSLARRGRSLTDMQATTHPSEPNYLALFSGSTQRLTNDSCPHRYAASNLGSELHTADLSFVGYSEGLPAAGSATCASGSYVRRHAPWTNFADLPSTVNQPLRAFPGDYQRLPTVSFVIPNLDHDMHDGTITQADTWLRQHLGAYASWARTHGSILVVTWDEDDRSEQNRIPTVIVGDGVTARRSSAPATLYSLLRLIEDRYQLPRLGAARTATPIMLR